MREFLLRFEADQIDFFSVYNDNGECIFWSEKGEVDNLNDQLDDTACLLVVNLFNHKAITVKLNQNG